MGAAGVGGQGLRGLVEGEDPVDDGLEAMLGDEALQWQTIAEQLRATRETFGMSYEGGARRTRFAEAGAVEEVPHSQLSESPTIPL